MLARDVMSSPVITVRQDTPVHAAAALLVSHGFTAAPVVDAAGRMIGIVAESDLVRGHIVPEGWTVEVDELPDATVAARMTPSPTAVRPEEDLAEVVALMLAARHRVVPVVDDGVLVGVVTRRDVLRVVARRELTGHDGRGTWPR